MRFVALAACVAIAATVAGCDPTTERRYFTEGAGVDLYTADRAQQIELQNQYIDFVCKQAGPACANGNWTAFVQAGMNDIDLRCDGFLTWLDARRRDKEPVLAELSALNTATHTIMTVSGASPKSLDIATAAFGLATQTYVNWNSRLLISINQSTVQTVVYSGQSDFRQKINGYRVPDQPTAIYLLRSYLRICMPTTIEAEINTTPTLVQRGDPMSVRDNPIVNPVRPYPTATRVRSDIGTDDARKILTQFVYPNGVMAARDAANEKEVKDFLKERKIRAPVGFFLDAAMYATQRTELVQRLKERGVIQ